MPTRARHLGAGAAFLLGALLLPAPAPATEVAVGVGADVWTAGSAAGLFSFTADPLWTVLPGLELGARTGLFFVTNGAPSGGTAGIPLDGQIRGVVGHFYLEGLVGPWFFFAGTVVRIHVGMGFGWQTGPIRIGAEVAYLDPGAQFGARFAFAF
ncbi:MAG TPA: hypothetical protein VEJ89_16215 [Myxococcaceae bacterium]|jgi:hypothetical protein|nr:hypothetical protein [Myxococcaceae bacterium]